MVDDENIDKGLTREAEGAAVDASAPGYTLDDSLKNTSSEVPNGNSADESLFTNAESKSIISLSESDTIPISDSIASTENVLDAFIVGESNKTDSSTQGMITSNELDSLFGDVTASSNSIQTPDYSAETTILDSFSSSELDALLFAGDTGNNLFMRNDALNLNDILGVNPSNGKDGGSSDHGIETLLKKTTIYYEHLPMLEVVFDHLIRLLSTSLRNFTSENIELSIESIKSKRLGDYLNSVPLPAMFSIFKAEEWDNQGLIVVDNTIIYSIVDALLGGRHNSEFETASLRLYTTIEHNLVSKFIAVVLQDCSLAFQPVGTVHFTYERIEYNPHFAMISRPTSPGIVLTIKFEIDEHFGKFSLFFPYATLEPIRELLMQNFMGEKFGRDSIWVQHLVKELKETDVQIDIVLLREMFTLSEILEWKVGDTITFNVPAETKVIAYTGNCPLFLGMIGHKNGSIAVKVEEIYIKDNITNMEQNHA